MISLRKEVAILVVFSFCIVPICIQAQNTTTANTPTTTEDAGWPRQMTHNGSTLVYYQPQIDGWNNYTNLQGRAAFSLTPQNGKLLLGVVSFEAETTVDKESRTVYFHDVKYTDIRFQSQDQSENSNMDQLFRSFAPTAIEPISLDRVMAEVDQGKTPERITAVNNDPPEIFYSSTPAILLTVQGEPALNPIEKTEIESVVNTNWDLFFDKSKKQYYLLANNIWLMSSTLDGPWTVTKTLPKDMSKLPVGQNWDAVKRMIPPSAVVAIQPMVFYSTKPAELITTTGKPVFSRIAGTQLLYITNTENDVFLSDAEQDYYVLLSGRWFRAKSLHGPWSYASDSLPADFSKIPETSSKGRVLASVPGTVAASDAVMLAEVPTTVTVNRAEAEAKARAQYNGEPQFKPIEQTNLEYATNTQDKVIKDGDLYYLCFQGVWFMSTTPNGPWKTADSVPKEIYTIPPNSPVYNVTYVTQTNPTTTTVESSTTAGYFGMFVIGMATGVAIAYGTGYYYPPYWGPGPYFPVYYPWPATYGAGVVYNPWTGGWAGGRAVYGPYGAAGSAAWYNPATGRYGRAASVQGWYGGRTVAAAYNPWTGGFAATSQGHNAYSQWGTSVASRYGKTIQTAHINTANGSAFGYRTNTGQHGGVIHGPNGTVIKGPNSVYAGHDGNVYRKDSSGNWSQYNNGNWNPVNPDNQKQNFQNNHLKGSQGGAGNRGRSGSLQNISPDTLGGLNRSAASRQRGQMQSQRFSNFRQGGGRFRR